MRRSRPPEHLPNGLPSDASMRAPRPDALYAEAAWLRDRRVFMFIGGLYPWRRIGPVDRSLCTSRAARDCTCPGAPGLLASRSTLEKLGEWFDISSNLVFTGPAFGEDRANLFAGADVFVHPSRWEGLSMSVLAAAAAGKPCLITRDADPYGELERAQAAMIV